MTGALLDLILQEVTIASDYVTQPVENGERYRLDSWAFDLPVESAAGSEECGGHGHLHGDHCHCDDGYVVDPTNSLNCIPE